MGCLLETGATGRKGEVGNGGKSLRGIQGGWRVDVGLVGCSWQ